MSLSEITRKPVGILTCNGLDEYKAVQKKVIDFFRKREIPCKAVVWDEPHNWSDFRLLVVHSTWYYQDKIQQFLSVLETINQAGIQLVNSIETLKWNHNKSYLQDLSKKGISIPETVWLSKEQLPTIPQIAQERRWEECVLKPAVGAGGNSCFRFNPHHKLDAIIQEASELSVDWMLQPFLPEIISHGELSFFFLGGSFVHAVRKAPAANEFRVQPFRGATTVKLEPEPWMVNEAKRVLATCPGEPLIARIDMIQQDQGLLLMEAELIEPDLYDAYCADVSKRFFTTILGQLIPVELGILYEEITEPLTQFLGCATLTSLADKQYSLVAKNGEQAIGQCSSCITANYWKAIDGHENTTDNRETRLFYDIHKKSNKLEQEYLAKSNLLPERSLHCTGLAVPSEYRGLGIATKLIQSQKAKFEQAGVRSFFYSTTHSRAEALLQRQGFEQVAKFSYTSLAKEFGYERLKQLEGRFAIWHLAV